MSSSTVDPQAAGELESKPKGRRRLRTVLINLAVLGGSLLIGLIVGEIAVRLFWPPLIMPRWVENAPYGIRKNLGNIRGHIVFPEYRHKVTSNSEGFRGTREYALKKPGGVFRVVAMGDSVVNGYGVEDEETFCALLEKRLGSKRPTEVLNMGVPGFSTAEELIQLQHVGLRYEPDLVVVGYFINDHFENLISGLFLVKDGKLVRNPAPADPAIRLRDRLSRIPGYNFLCQHSYLVNFLRSKASGFFRNKVAAKHDSPDYLGDKLSNEQIALTAALLDEIIRICDERGIRIVILNIPMKREDKWFRNLPLEQLKLKDKARIVDVAEEIYKGREIKDIAHELSYHPKPVGHELIAEWLAKYVQEEHWSR